MIGASHDRALDHAAVGAIDGIHRHDRQIDGERTAGTVRLGQTHSVGRWVGRDPLRTTGITGQINAAQTRGRHFSRTGVDTSRYIDAFTRVITGTDDVDNGTAGRQSRGRRSGKGPLTSDDLRISRGRRSRADQQYHRSRTGNPGEPGRSATQTLAHQSSCSRSHGSCSWLDAVRRSHWESVTVHRAPEDLLGEANTDILITLGLPSGVTDVALPTIAVAPAPADRPATPRRDMNLTHPPNRPQP